MQNQQLKPQGAIEMTMAEWKATHRDFKGIYNGQRHLLRMTSRGTGLVPVTIVKENEK